MLDTEPNVESSRYPGVFVTRKKKTAKFAETSTTFPFSFADDMSDFEWDQDPAEKSHRADSPSSELGSEQCLSSDTSCQARFHQLAKDAEIEDSEYDDKNQKRPKRKKSKDKKPEINTALDAIRYKTKMCKNWQLYEKCPYGPRCLFAHGAKELRTYAVNHSAITTAASSESPERQFYALGHFPSFIPVPFRGSSCSSMASDDNVSEEHTEEHAAAAVTVVKADDDDAPRKETPSPEALTEGPVDSVKATMGSALQVTTHSPYTTPPSPPHLPAAATAAAHVSPPSPVFSSLPTGFPYASSFAPPPSLANLCRCPPCPRVQDVPASMGLTPPAVLMPPPPIMGCVTPPPILSLTMGTTPPSPTTPSPYGAFFGAAPGGGMVSMASTSAALMGGCCAMFTPAPAPCVAMPCSMQLATFPQQATFPWQMATPAWGVSLGMEPKLYW